MFSSNSLKRLSTHMKTAYLFAFKESDDGTTYYIVLEGSQYIGEIMFFYRKSLIAGK